MLLGSPEVTPYDLRFRLFRIPIRVHPLFWLIMLILGAHAGELVLAIRRIDGVFIGCVHRGSIL